MKTLLLAISLLAASASYSTASAECYDENPELPTPEQLAWVAEVAMPASACADLTRYGELTCGPGGGELGLILCEQPNGRFYVISINEFGTLSIYNYAHDQLTPP